MNASITSRAGLLLGLLCIAAGPALAAKTTRANVQADGTQGWGGVYTADFVGLSGDGRYVVFDTYDALVPSDTNSLLDVYAHDRVTGAIERITLGSDGSDAYGSTPSISADGRYVAFASSDNRLHPDAGNQAIFVRDRKTGRTTYVSAGTALNTRPFLSADGRYVAFLSDYSTICRGTGANYIHVHDRKSGKTVCASVATDGTVGNDYNVSQSLSADGRYLLFRSAATNLVPGDTNGYCDLFLRDMQRKTTRRVAETPELCSGYSLYDQNARISADGRFATIATMGALGLATTNGNYQVHVINLKSGATERVSVSNAGVQGNANSSHPRISADGRFVAFYSDAMNLVTGDTNNFADVFVHDRTTHKTALVSLATNGSQANAFAGPPAISGEGRYVAFPSTAENLVAGDTNATRDAFLRDRLLDNKRSADVSVAFASGPTSGAVGDTLTYVVDVTANGGDAANTQTQVVVPSTLTPVSVAITQGSCTLSNQIVCRSNTLAAGTRARLTLQVRPKATGSVTLTAFAGANPRDGKGGNNSATRALKVQ